MIFNLERISKIQGLQAFDEVDLFENFELDLEDPKIKSNNSLNEVQKNFCDKIKLSLDILDSFVSVIDEENKKSSAAVKVVHLQMNAKFKFIGF